MAKILAIETSCDETAAAVIEDGRKILSDIVYSQADIHAIFGGVVPEIASRKHIDALDKVVKKALIDSNLSFSDIDAVAVTSCPGLVGALLTGVSYAKSISYALSKPLISVHHIKGHIAANYLADENFKPPFLSLVVSGGHTQVVYAKDYLSFEILAKTRDDAVGEAFDKVARIFGLPYPGGVSVDKMAQNGDYSKMSFTKPKLDSQYDFSFSGIKTALNCYIQKLEKSNNKSICDYKNDEFFTIDAFSGLGLKVKEGGISKNDVAAAFSHTVASMLTDSFFKLAKEKNVKKVCMAGGVSANSVLRKMFFEKAQKEGLYAVCPPLSLCGDNAAMIGSQAYYKYEKGLFSGYDLNAVPYISVTDDI